MPKCPEGELGPPDVIGNAVKVVRTLTGEFCVNLQSRFLLKISWLP